MRKLFLLLMLLASLHAEMFEKGQASFSLAVGSGSFNTYRETRNYTIVGLGVGYYVLDGLNIGLGYRGWFGASPAINEVDIPIVYYVPLKKVRPYIGTFYRHTFIEGYDDYDTSGYRLGVAYNANKRSYVSLGLVHEFYTYGADNLYPEIAFGATF